MYSAQVLTQDLYPQFVNAIRELSGGALIMLPSSIDDFEDPMLRKIIHTTQRAAAMEPEDKVKFLKACWDAVGSEFGSRHQQYEMFYAGARFVTAGHSFRTLRLERGHRPGGKPARFLRPSATNWPARSTGAVQGMKIAIVNLGEIVSGDWRHPIASGDTILVRRRQHRARRHGVRRGQSRPPTW